MYIGIDGNEANISNRVGVGQFAYQTLSHISKLDKKNHYTIYLKQAPLPDMPPATSHWQYQIFGPSKFWTRFALPFHLISTYPRPDIFFSPSHYTPFFSPIPTICSIMDLGYLHYPFQFTAKDRYQLTNWSQESIKKSKHIITISEFTKNEIVNIYHINPDKITIAYPGVSPPPKIIPDSSLPSRFFLSLGTLKPSKNISFLIDSFAIFSQTHQDYYLIIAGKKGWLFDAIFSAVKKNNITDKVIFKDYITEIQKWSLLKQATALVIPSYYEGFGIPAIEAMSVATPVISSQSSSLPEIVKNYGLLIDPTSTKSLVNALNSIITPSIHKKYQLLGPKRAANFTWEKAARNIINVFNQL